MSAVVEHIRRRALTASGINSINPRPPPRTSPHYDLNLATLASKVLYRSGVDPTGSGGPLLILCAAAFPDTRYVDYNKLLPYVLSNLPGEDELSEGRGYSVVFFAGGGGEKVGGEKCAEGMGSPGGGADKDGGGGGGRWNRPAWSWSLQAYNLLSRAVRKNIRKLWIVHERPWVRILFEMSQMVVSPKFKKKVVHVNSLSELATLIPLQNLNIPPSVYLHDRKHCPTLTVPNPPPPMFGVQPFPSGELEPKLPLVLIDTSRYLRTHHLKTEGLFRIPPSMQLLDIAKEAYDRGQYIRCMDYGPHVAAGLIKLYYRSLPEPLIPPRCYAEIEAKYKNPEDVKTMLLGHEGKGGLPFTTRILLTRHLLPLMAAVATHHQHNKMTPENLAICIAPSLVRGEDPLKDMMFSRGPLTGLLCWGIENIEEFAPEKPIKVASIKESIMNVVKKEKEAAKRPDLERIDTSGSNEQAEANGAESGNANGNGEPSAMKRSGAIKVFGGQSPLSPRFSRQLQQQSIPPPRLVDPDPGEEREKWKDTKTEQVTAQPEPSVKPTNSFPRGSQIPIEMSSLDAAIAKLQEAQKQEIQSQSQSVHPPPLPKKPEEYATPESRGDSGPSSPASNTPPLPNPPLPPNPVWERKSTAPPPLDPIRDVVAGIHPTANPVSQAAQASPLPLPPPPPPMHSPQPVTIAGHEAAEKLPPFMQEMLRQHYQAQGLQAASQTPALSSQPPPPPPTQYVYPSQASTFPLPTAPTNPSAQAPLRRGSDQSQFSTLHNPNPNPNSPPTAAPAPAPSRGPKSFDEIMEHMAEDQRRAKEQQELERLEKQKEKEKEKGGKLGKIRPPSFIAGFGGGGGSHS